MTTHAPGIPANAPGAWPLLGHLPHLRRDPLAFLRSLPVHGDLVRIRLGPIPAFVLCDPELVHQMLRAPATFDKGGLVFDKARKLVADGLITSTWPDHQRQRPLLQPAFSRPRLAAYTDVMREEVGELARTWQSGQILDIPTEMNGLIARITARTLFRADLGAAAIEVIQYALPVIVDGLYRRMMDPSGWWEKLPTPANRRYDDASARLHAVIDQLIADHRADGSADSRHAGSTDEDTLSVLLAAGENGDRLTATEVHDQIFTLLNAGIETTATTLSWALHLLGGHPEVQERVHAEITGELDGRLPAFEDLPRLDYTRCVLTEVMRLYPPAWLLTRTATADARLGDHRVPAGSTLVFSPYLIQRDPRLFNEPERFDPDRWMSRPGRTSGQHALFPFGGGARKCIGDVFSINESLIALAGITARWRLTPAAGPPTRAVPKAFLTPEPLRLIAHARPYGPTVPTQEATAP